MAAKDSFSRRNRYAGAAKVISIREDAPEGLRVTVLDAARKLGLDPSRLRTIACQALRVRPDADNWSEPNVWNEVQALMHECEWFNVYGIIEALHARFVENDATTSFVGEGIDWQSDATSFADDINAYFVEEGIGWKLVDGQIITRSTEAFESIVPAAVALSIRPKARCCSSSPRRTFVRIRVPSRRSIAAHSARYSWPDVSPRCVNCMRARALILTRLETSSPRLIPATTWEIV